MHLYVFPYSPLAAGTSPLSPRAEKVRCRYFSGLIFGTWPDCLFLFLFVFFFFCFFCCSRRPHRQARRRIGFHKSAALCPRPNLVFCLGVISWCIIGLTSGIPLAFLCVAHQRPEAAHRLKCRSAKTKFGSIFVCVVSPSTLRLRFLPERPRDQLR